MFFSVLSPRWSQANPTCPELVDNRRGRVHSSRLGQRLKARGYIDGIAEDIAVLDHDVAQTEPNAHQLRLLLGEPSISRSQHLLKFCSAAGRGDGAREFGQESI